MAANETSRVQSIDVLRTLALLCVLSIHSLRAAIAQVNGQDLSGLTGNQIAASCAIGLSTLGVPLFLMISGYLLLDRDYTKERTLAFFKRNLLPLIVSYEIFDLALAVLCVSAAWSNLHADGFQSSLAFTPVVLGGCMLFLAVVRALRGRRIPNALYRPVRSVAVCSYGMYVLHYPIVLFMKYAPLPVHGWALYHLVRSGMAGVSIPPCR